MLHTGNGIIKGLLGKMASLVGGVEDLVVKDGEVEGQAEADGVGRRKIGRSNIGRSLVSLERLVGRGFALVSKSELGEVAVVVSLPVRRVVSPSAP